MPQGTVLGPILFLLYINDLPDGEVNSTARLFADDCIVYRSIRNVHDAILLQNDLNSIVEWELTWEMKFNIDKCFIMRSGRARQKSIHQYTLHDQPLVETESAKYLGITLTPDLKWNKHINNITNKANSMLGILRRNLRISSHTVKTHAYQALVRPHIEYASSVWDPHTQCNTRKLEMVQRRAARYVYSRWHTSSVTEMVNQLGWDSLAKRRQNSCLCALCKLTHTAASDQWLTADHQTTRGSHAWKCIPIQTTNNILYKLSFLPCTIIVWNRLPCTLVASPSLNAFRAGLSKL